MGDDLRPVNGEVRDAPAYPLVTHEFLCMQAREHGAIWSFTGAVTQCKPIDQQVVVVFGASSCQEITTRRVHEHGREGTLPQPQ